MPAAKKQAKKAAKKAPRKIEKRVGPSGPEAYRLYREALEAAPRAPQTGTHPSAIQYGTRKTPELCALFLGWLAKGYVPQVAAQNVGIARATAFNWKREDPAFAEAWEEAVEAGIDLLEQEVRRRAVEGVARPVFQQGECVGFTQEYSDSLAAMMLQGRRKRVYGRQPEDGKDTNVTIVIKGGLPEKEK